MGWFGERVVGWRPATCAFRHTSRGFVGWVCVRLNDPTLSREARLSVGFTSQSLCFLSRVRMIVGYASGSVWIGSSM